MCVYVCICIYACIISLNTHRDNPYSIVNW